MVGTRRLIAAVVAIAAVAGTAISTVIGVPTETAALAMGLEAALGGLRALQRDKPA